MRIAKAEIDLTSNSDCASLLETKVWHHLTKWLKLIDGVKIAKKQTIQILENVLVYLIEKGIVFQEGSSRRDLVGPPVNIL